MYIKNEWCINDMVKIFNNLISFQNLKKTTTLAQEPIYVYKLPKIVRS